MTDPMFEALDAFDARLQQSHQVVVVGDPETGVLFAYTVGLSPELVIRGLHPRTAQQVLNLLADKGPIELGEIDLGGQFPLRAVPDDSKHSDWGLAVRFHLRDDFDRLLLWVPDKAGHYPDDPLCDEAVRRSQQPR